MYKLSPAPVLLVLLVKDLVLHPALALDLPLVGVVEGAVKGLAEELGLAAVERVVLLLNCSREGLIISLLQVMIFPKKMTHIFSDLKKLKRAY